jgi:Zn-dependent M28 family amino/carboxypeptidase
MISKHRLERKLPPRGLEFLSFAAAILLIHSTHSHAAAASSESPDQIATTLAQKALTNSAAMELITDLTTENGPRLAGSAAEKRAAEWARRRFEQLGFDKIWIETFPLEHGWIRGIEKAEVVSPSPQPLVVTALGGSVATPPEGLEAEIALFKTYAELLALPTNSLKGKIAVVTQPMIRGRTEAGYGALNRMRNAGPGEASRRGAVGYLLRSLGTDTVRRPHTGATHYAADAPPIPAAALTAPDAEQLERLVAKGSAVRVRMILTPRDLGPATSQNVIAEIKGREKSDDLVLLGAHLDSWDLGTGAVDDGAGVAIVMAAGKLIHDLPQRPKRTIRVVLFGSEEIGLFGGKAYAEKHKLELNRHVILAEPDVGQGPVVAFQTGVANPDDSSLKRIREVLAPLGITAGDNRSRGDSDVEPMVEAGVPAATLRLDASDYFDLHHTPDDTLDKIKPERLNQSTAAYAVFGYLAAELDGEYRAKPSAATK